MSHAQNSVMWLVLSERSVKAVRNHCLHNHNRHICQCANLCMHAWVSEVLIMIGVSLSEPNTYVTAMHKSVCKLVGLLVWTNHLLYTWNEHI